MKKLLLAAALLVWATAQDLRADLLIKKDGKSIWLMSCEEQAGGISYKTTEDGPEENIPLSDVAVILPSAQPDGKYTPEQADDAIGLINRTAGKYPHLRKQIELLKQQWQQVKEPDTEADGKIDQMARQFQESDKSPKKFQDIAAQMQMIAFRDAVGTVNAKIKKKIAEMQQVVFDTAKVKIETMANAEKKTVENYVNLRRLISEVKMARATDEQKKYLDTVLDKCKKATLESGLKASQLAFFGNKTIDGYLACMAILHGLNQNEVPVSAAEKAEVDRYLRTMLSAAKMQCKQYDFENNGYPLDAKDKQLLGGRKFDSSGAHGGMLTIEHCYLIVTDVPADAKQGDSISPSVRLVFNRAPLPGRKYSLIADFFVPGNSKREIQEVSIQGMRAGHVDTKITLTVPRLAPNFGNGPARWNGVTGLSIVLAYLDYRMPVSDQMEWIAASGVCSIGIGAQRALPDGSQ